MRFLSQKTRYALGALQYLARGGGRGPVLISAIAAAEAIPQKFLEAILLELKRQGVLVSKKGKGGGYAFRSGADQVTLGQIIRIFDGPLAPLPCASGSARAKCAECDDDATCGVRFTMRAVRDAMAAILDQTTIADVVRRSDLLQSERCESAAMYYI